MVEIRKVAVLGCGLMGSGIAEVAARAGYETWVREVTDELAEKGKDSIARSLGRAVERGRLGAEERDAALARIHTTTELDALSDADIVIEAVTEDLAIKNELFRALDELCPPETIFASNTSSLTIADMAAATRRPDRMVGLHFFNPVPVMKLVEVIRGIATEESTFETAKEYVTRLEKTMTVAEDFPAFIVNRILLPMINEAIYTLYEGVGSVEAIDTAMKLGANHPMGPLQLADFIGLDTCLSIMQVLYEGLADSKYRPCPLLVKYVEAGWLGRKAGRGFYDYREDPPVPTR